MMDGKDGMRDNPNSSIAPLFQSGSIIQLLNDEVNIILIAHSSVVYTPQNN